MPESLTFFSDHILLQVPWAFLLALAVETDVWTQIIHVQIKMSDITPQKTLS
jgi:hypothetical protein